MKWARWSTSAAALSGLLIAALHTNIAAAQTPGTPYAVARQTLISEGYAPVVFPRGGPYDQCQDGAICQAYPEVLGCSGTGFNPCRFAFRAADGTFLVGSASGETPDQLTLDGIAAANAEDSRSIENLLEGRPELADDSATTPSDAPDVSPSAVSRAVASETPSGSSDQTVNTAMFLALILAGLAIYLLPTIIAFSRRHRFRFPIMAFNIGAGWSGIGWIWTLVWSVWPERSAMLEPIVGDATGIERRS